MKQSEVANSGELNKPKRALVLSKRLVGGDFFDLNLPEFCLSGRKPPWSRKKCSSARPELEAFRHNFFGIVLFFNCLAYLCPPKGGVYYDHCKRKRERIHRKSAEAF